MKREREDNDGATKGTQKEGEYERKRERENGERNEMESAEIGNSDPVRVRSENRTSVHLTVLNLDLPRSK